jgi:hypothetical protein
MFKKRNPKISVSLERALLFLEMAVLPWDLERRFAHSQRQLSAWPVIDATETFATDMTSTSSNALMEERLGERFTPAMIFMTAVVLFFSRQPDSSSSVQPDAGPGNTDVCYSPGPDGIDRSPPVYS